ncbi:hypothetical protein LJ737_14325 [Hymenobacter sp. 15J16-1T3B]|uniref:hypothetical protein n=1 Tax=Hymenobacter sp. 15J16-1T3B TaxID=2886941 RepID=UPI001D0F5F54|nr:hypothetical protein [Hymenobacter sp. 15J16-1T3B]MCC3158422.1 hypothetical protein [Hymenobacter sp. 15J16-1T3B]
MNYFLILPVAACCLLASCQTRTAADQPPVVQNAPAPTTASAATEADARAALARYLRQQPQANLYVVDSARLVEVDALWQALVPRTDWAKRMPNRAAFEIDKLTGEVRPLPVR